MIMVNVKQVRTGPFTDSTHAPLRRQDGVVVQCGDSVAFPQPLIAGGRLPAPLGAGDTARAQPVGAAGVGAEETELPALPAGLTQAGHRSWAFSTSFSYCFSASA